jgi:hypothetical protein
VKYVINDKYFKGFEVLETYNGWWADRVKVEDFFKCIKQGYNQKQARIFIGISEQQLRDFRELHPMFQQALEHCEEVCRMMTETNISSFLQEKDKQTTRWYAEKRIPEKYGKSEEAPTGNTINNYGTLINAPLEQRTKPIPTHVIERLNKYENGEDISEPI